MIEILFSFGVMVLIIPISLIISERISTHRTSKIGRKFKNDVIKATRSLPLSNETKVMIALAILKNGSPIKPGEFVECAGKINDLIAERRRNNEHNF
jgi:hypothetical protein